MFFRLTHSFAVTAALLTLTTLAGCGTHSDATPPAQVWGDGEYVVGRDIQPGYYQTTGPVGKHCKYQRWLDPAMRPQDLSVYGDVVGSTVIVIQAKDKALTLTGGCLYRWYQPN